MLRGLLVLVLAVSLAAFLAGCGGDDDDDGGGFPGNGDDSSDDGSGDDDSGDDDSSDGDSGDDDSGDDSGDGDDSGSGGGNIDLDEIPDGSYLGGSMHLEVSGDADQELDLEEGNGFATGGFVTIVFADDDSETAINIVFGDEDEPGAMTLVTDDVVTGAEWGSDCDVTVRSDDDGLSGEFDCESLDGYNPDNNDIYDDVNVRGEFSIPRE